MVTLLAADKSRCEVCGTDYQVNPARRSKTRTCSRACRYRLGRVGILDRFWSKVDRGPDHGPDGDCWVWTARGEHGRRIPLQSGYGQFKYLHYGRSDGAHRVAYQLECGPIPDGLSVLHRCDNPPCVRPDHLFLGTPADNMADMAGKGRAKPPKGEDQPEAKLTTDQVQAIRHDPRTLRAIAADYGVSHSLVHGIKARQRWSHVQ